MRVPGRDGSYQAKNQARLAANEGTLEYLIDMLHEMAEIARRSGEDQIAIHQDAIIAAQRAIAKDRSEQGR